MTDENEPAAPQDFDEENFRTRTEARLRGFLDQMESDYDSVCVFVTKSLPKTERTMSLQRGCGNFYANIAVTREWVLKQEEDSRIDQRQYRQAIEEEGDDEEDDDE